MPELAAFDVNTWFGIFAPAGTPRTVTQSINAAMEDWQKTPEIQARWREMGGVPLSGSMEQFHAFVANEIEKWGNVIRKEGLQLDLS
jgi:tripartite-type tricarboxylate transporter receptor subunit TctC